MRKKFLRRNTTRVSGAKGVRGANQVPRRSVTITDENNSRITRTRGWFMTGDVDVNFATLLNLFIELGYKAFNLPWSPEVKETVRRYLLDAVLLEEGAMDEFVDVFYKRLREEQKKRLEEESKVAKAIQQ